MQPADIQRLFDLTGRVAVVTGGAGVLGSALCRGLAAAGAIVAVLGLHAGKAEKLAAEIRSGGAAAFGLACDVLDRGRLEAAAQVVRAEFGRVDILVNGAGGNRPQATTGAQQPFFDLNLMGTVLPAQVFGSQMAAQKSGVILNISSMNAFRPLTRIPAYSAAKAGVSNFTRWLAVHMACEYSPEIRVNAIAPGFFLTEQNRFLLTEAGSGELTARGRAILDHTPLGRFGTPDDLLGAALWLVSPASAFVTGVVIPVDGGFSAFSGV